MEMESCVGNRSSSSDLVVTDLPDKVHKLFCVEFPGLVKNEASAIEKLGGLDSLSKVHSEKGRLELRFRPDDQYCKPTTSKATIGSSLILKVKRKKLPSSENGSSSIQHSTGKEYHYSAELLGIANKTYQFSGMADYQVLPPGMNTENYGRCVVDPSDFQIKEPLDDDLANRDVLSFLPPLCFSKFDRPHVFRQVKSGRPSTEDGAMKAKKMNLAYTVSFDSVGVPTQPNPDAVSSINPNHPLVSKIKKLFEERPVWTRMGLQWRVKTSTQVKIRGVLPLLAYNFSTGPFKRLWIKFGYDPRSSPTSKIFQTIDIRVPKDVCIAEPQQEVCPGKEQGEALSSEIMEEVNFTFFPDKLPSQRQLCYQLCDIHDKECQEIIHHNDGKEADCNAINGWCEDNAYEKLRKILTTKIKTLSEHTTKHEHQDID